VEPGSEYVVGSRQAPTRVVRFRGDRLRPAVLGHLWQQRPNARGPMVRWLTGLAADPRPAVSVRAALTAGTLCELDCAYLVEELIEPLALSEEYQLNRFAAIALGQAAQNPELQPAVSALVAHWARNENGRLRHSAALALGRGPTAASQEEALDRIALLATLDDGAELAAGASAVVELAAAGPARPVLDRIRRWLSHRKVEYQNLGLLSGLWVLNTPVWATWEPTDKLMERPDWPLGPALAEQEPELTQALAGQLWTALHTSRCYGLAMEVVGLLLREARGKDWADALADFLARTLATEDDRVRLRDQLDRLDRDYDPPLDPGLARRLRLATEGVKVL
jgi:hypothetical protein